LQQWLPDKPPSKIIVAVGPEGGFTNEEVEFALKNQWLAWVLTQNILRVETAVLMSAILVLDFVTHS
jgi:RsmE family RNA methyltransferase